MPHRSFAMKLIRQQREQANSCDEKSLLFNLGFRKIHDRTKQRQMITSGFPAGNPRVFDRKEKTWAYLFSERLRNIGFILSGKT